MLLSAVLVLAIGGGIAAAFAQAKLQASYTTAARLAAASGLPVIGALTRVETPAARAEDRRRLKWLAGGSGALVGAFALLMAVEFIQRSGVA